MIMLYVTIIVVAILATGCVLGWKLLNTIKDIIEINKISDVDFDED